MTTVRDLLTIAHSNLMLTKDDLQQTLNLATTRHCRIKWTNAIYLAQKRTIQAISQLESIEHRIVLLPDPPEAP